MAVLAVLSFRLARKNICLVDRSARRRTDRLGDVPLARRYRRNTAVIQRHLDRGAGLTAAAGQHHGPSREAAALVHAAAARTVAGLRLARSQSITSDSVCC